MTAAEAYEAIKQLAPSTGDEFHSRDLAYKVQGSDLKQLFIVLRDLAAEGKIKFTGRTCRFVRLV